MKKYTELVQDILSEIEEVFPWDVEESLNNNEDLILLDIREADEFNSAKIANSINVPRGLLEGACDWGYDDTVPELAAGRDKDIIVICRSGNRSALAAYTMKLMGFTHAKSLKTGLRGWNDSEQELIDAKGNKVDIDDADELFANKVRPEQMQKV